MLAMWKMGDKEISGPVWGLVSQIFWWWLMIHTSLWGLLLINASMVFIHIRNLMLWRKEDASNSRT